MLATEKLIRIGTRKSALALAQTAMVADALLSIDQTLTIQTHEMLTTGDRRQGTPQAGQGDKKEWVIELERGLLEERIDCAVHSAKDVPVDIEPGTVLLPVFIREFPLDVLIPRALEFEKPLSELPKGAKVGTASLRRQAQIRRMYPDLEIVELRGNVTTRIQRLDESLVDVAILAEAGLRRLKLARSYLQIPATEMVPAMNQGILVVQFRLGDDRLEALFTRLVHKQVLCAFLCEREVVRRLQADCRSALGVYAETRADRLYLQARVCSRNSDKVIEFAEQGEIEEYLKLAENVSEKLLQAGAKALLHI